ncbi:DUF3500 domain-containing protein [Granulicella arctica]|uniref:DUF3500 domain-containing protein n=1 Tax=Granulicella arctica TaxID=940613 RepID=UPI0021DFE9D1|nr:DUF3500 domain-containing protein [Granulicella arctica]
MSLYREALQRFAILGTLSLIAVSAVAQNPTDKIVTAANNFLSTLDQKQRQSVMYSFDDNKQRARWSNFPTGFIPRGGINLRSMTPAQRAAAMSLLSVTLSKRGYEKVQEIMEGDEVNKLEEAKNGNRGPGGGGPRGINGPPPGAGGPPDGAGNRPPFGGPGGPPGLSADLFGKDLYYISFLGTPSEKNPWMIQFGGHHLALNITIAGDKGVLTPTLTGAQPALYTTHGRTIRPLGQESDKALTLLKALDEAERKKAVLSYKLADLVLGPGQDGVIIQPEGLQASLMNDKQRVMLLDVISEWAGIINDTAATARMAQLKVDLNETWFSWSGPTDGTLGKNISAYYRIQGPHLVIEYAPQALGGDASLHVHTMYRDPTNDYGKGIVKK